MREESRETEATEAGTGTTSEADAFREHQMKRRIGTDSSNYSAEQKASLVPSAYLLNKERRPREVAAFDAMCERRPRKPPQRKQRSM